MSSAGCVLCSVPNPQQIVPCDFPLELFILQARDPQVFKGLKPIGLVLICHLCIENRSDFRSKSCPVRRACATDDMGTAHICYHFSLNSSILHHLTCHHRLVRLHKDKMLRKKKRGLALFKEKYFIRVTGPGLLHIRSALCAPGTAPYQIKVNSLSLLCSTNSKVHYGMTAQGC